MIDVRFVVAHSLWIVGAALVLTAFSYYDWLARDRGHDLRDVIRESSGWSLSVGCGLLLVASGLVMMAETDWWQWLIGAIVWAVSIAGLWRGGRPPKHQSR